MKLINLYIVVLTTTLIILNNIELKCQINSDSSKGISPQVLNIVNQLIFKNITLDSLQKKEISFGYKDSSLKSDRFKYRNLYLKEQNIINQIEHSDSLSIMYSNHYTRNREFDIILCKVNISFIRNSIKKQVFLQFERLVDNNFYFVHAQIEERINPFHGEE